ncbi:MAG: hypothetical protein LEGION0398_MBIBDBAK_01271 [Legionellaceae bacterium]
MGLIFCLRQNIRHYGLPGTIGLAPSSLPWPTANELKKLYLLGQYDENSSKKMQSYLADKILSDYEISYSKETINNDPTRRYFETHLAFHTIKQELNNINEDDLSTYIDRMLDMLSYDKIGTISEALDGQFNEKSANNLKEYSEYILNLQEGKIFPTLTQEDRNKISLIVKCALIGVACISDPLLSLPLNIYNKGLFSKEKKGKKLIEEQSTTRNHHFGLMKGYMPLSDNDIAHADTEYRYLKPSDQSTYQENTDWVEDSFTRLVHPYSNSISGTVLSQLRLLLQINRLYNLDDDPDESVFTQSAEKLTVFTKLLISALLFNSGGHSLHEFTAPFTIAEVQKQFETVENFNKINLHSMFLSGNKDSFDEALQSTINYNNMLLIRNKLLEQIRDNQKPLEKTNFITSTNSYSDTQHLNQNRILNFVLFKQEFYADRIRDRFLSPLRYKSKKNELLQLHLEKVKFYIREGNYKLAAQEIDTLKSKFVKNFGKRNFFGALSESFKLIESIEKYLNTGVELNNEDKIITKIGKTNI